MTSRTLRSRLTRVALTAALAFGLLSGTAAAQDVSVSANAGWVSQYFYRGLLQKTSSASAGLDISAGLVSLGTWAADVGDGSEIDVYGSVGGGNDTFSFSVGGTGYFYTGQFDDTYLEANFNAGAGPLGVEFSIGQYENFGMGEQDYWFLGISASHEGFSGTVGTFGQDFDGTYGEVGYGFSAGDMDWSISGIVNDSTLSGLFDDVGAPAPGFTLVFGVSKTFDLTGN
tara:strand:+ start:185 stop:868 length:684 start_codon:yes stop_codon:yes gene_type:complete